MLKKIIIKNKNSNVHSEYTPNSLNIFVGPNNSGKSLLLREIFQDLTQVNQSSETLLLDGSVVVPPSREIIDHLFQKNKDMKISAYETYLYFFDKNDNQIDSMSMSDFKRFAENQVEDYQSSDYKRFKVRVYSDNVMLLNGAARLQSMVPVDFSTRQISYINNPVNSLLNKKDLFDKLKDFILDAFNLYLEIFLDGGQANFVLSKEPLPDDLRLSVKPEATQFLLSKSYNDINTSDGRKAYLGILAEIIAGNPELLLLDEPEAFLHPPLARKLGKVISKLIDSDKGKQIFIATHSADFIMGCIEAHVPMNLIRLTYDNEQSTFKPIDQEILLKIMNNPLLKSTNILKAIFYQKVIVTESDSDRAFYEEINSRLLEYNPKWGIKDCLFVNAQNKQTTGVIVKTLRDIGVAAIAIVDLDFLKDGGREFADKYLSPANIPTPSHSGLQSNRSTLKLAFKTIQDDSGSDKPELMKVKGLDAFKDADTGTYQTGIDFIQTLNSYGLFPVPIGELESWLKHLNIPGHGSNWLTAIFEKMGDNPASDDFIKPSDDDVWKFLSTIKVWFDNPEKKGMKA